VTKLCDALIAKGHSRGRMACHFEAHCISGAGAGGEQASRFHMLYCTKKLQNDGNRASSLRTGPAGPFAMASQHIPTPGSCLEVTSSKLIEMIGAGNP
jgi:hypothetical protein